MVLAHASCNGMYLMLPVAFCLIVSDNREVVPKKGLEPPHPCGYMDLNHARLPIPPLRLEVAGRVSHRTEQPSANGRNKILFSQSRGKAVNARCPIFLWAYFVSFVVQLQ